MSKADEPAFPTDAKVLRRGLTKREYFAAMALQGFLAASWNNDDTADKAVRHADLLLAALERKPE
jgi:hypothetical protein